MFATAVPAHQDQAAIARAIPVDTIDGHNLRAFLLRRLDGDSLGGTVFSVWEQAKRLGLTVGDNLTTLGREVAELLRPRPWSARQTNVVRYKNTYMGCLLYPDGEEAAEFGLFADAQRAAELFTKADLDAAKSYRMETTT